MVAGKDKDVGDSMDMEETETTQASLTEERLRLEREALAVGIDSNATLSVKCPVSSEGVLFSGEVSVR